MPATALPSPPARLMQQHHAAAAMLRPPFSACLQQCCTECPHASPACHKVPAHMGVQMAEAALADEWVRHGDRLDLQRRCLRLGKPPRRWRRPPWAKQALQDPKEVCMPF